MNIYVDNAAISGEWSWMSHEASRDYAGVDKSMEWEGWGRLDHLQRKGRSIMVMMAEERWYPKFWEVSEEYSRELVALREEDIQRGPKGAYVPWPPR
jgi:hypothetical protein